MSDFEVDGIYDGARFEISMLEKRFIIYVYDGGTASLFMQDKDEAVRMAKHILSEVGHDG
jgi:hypothetical protein